MKRKYGFTLVELLIVLAVIAALIATITPLALNAIRRARASQVTQNIRSLASALENAAYVNGIRADRSINDATDSEAIAFAGLGRDIDQTRYNVIYRANASGAGTEADPFVFDGSYNVWVYTSADANADDVANILQDIQSTGFDVPDPSPDNIFNLGGLAHNSDDITFQYFFTFNVY